MVIETILLERQQITSTLDVDLDQNSQYLEKVPTIAFSLNIESTLLYCGTLVLDGPSLLLPVGDSDSPLVLNMIVSS